MTIILMSNIFFSCFIMSANRVHDVSIETLSDGLNVRTHLVVYAQPR